jgi:hypothetical protein
LAALLHPLLQLLALGWGERVAHGDVKIDPEFRQGELRSANFLELAVDRGSIRFVGGKKIVQVHPLDFQIGPVANFRFAEIGLLLADLSGLVGSNTDLLANLRVTQ